MPSSTIALIFFIAVVAVMILGILSIFISKDKRSLQRSGSFASLAAFHDFQGKDKQNAIETVIEKQSEKKWEDDERGEKKRIPNKKR
jgi:hypothetical protein